MLKILFNIIKNNKGAVIALAFEDLIRNDYMNYFDKLKLLQYLQQHDVIRFI